MADNVQSDGDDAPSKRSSHFNQQRSSLRSNRSSGLTTHSQKRLNKFDLDLHSPDSDTIPSSSSPAPYVPYTRSRATSSVKERPRTRPYTAHARSRSGPDDTKRLEAFRDAESLASPTIPLHNFEREHEHASTSRASKTRRPIPPSHLGSQLDITALPSITHPSSRMDPYARSKPTPAAQHASHLATQLYTVSYLIFFAIWGTLARIGLQALTFYPGAPVTFPNLWPNVAGTFIIGFLAHDRRLFADAWGERVPLPSEHAKIKKTIPLYIGLATGFCGSFTSFSSFMRDVFLALANELRAPVYHPGDDATATTPRHPGYSVLATLAPILVTLTACLGALRCGAHLASALERFTPCLPFRPTRRFVDPVFVFLGFGSWIGAAFLTIFPPHTAWRSQALFACVFAPFGCLARYYISLYLNPIRPTFPLGTFAVNIFGTAVLGMAYDLQHIRLVNSGVGGSVLGCGVLQGIEDGFCGALTTVSTWVAEMDSLKTGKAYLYGGVSVAVSVGMMVALMGSVRWGVGWEGMICKI
jgi:CrcB protein